MENPKMRNWLDTRWLTVLLLTYIAVVLTVDVYKDYQRDLRLAPTVPVKRGR